MAVARYYKTLFLPPLEGQYLIWKNEFSRYAARVDEIVQLGNLIGCSDAMRDNEKQGPNQAVLSMILLWRSSFPNWTQIIGPNEIMALNYPGEWTSPESTRLLRLRWNLDVPSGKALTASVNKNRLVTHGGLTHGEWVKIGKPDTPQEAADRLNEKYAATLFQGDSYMLTGRPSFSANPIFASPLREVYPSWIVADEDPPFGQIHGAPGLNTSDGRQALAAPFSPLESIDRTRYLNFGSIVTIRGANFFSVGGELPNDRKLKKYPEPWKPYIEKVPVADLREEIFSDE